MLTTYLEVLRTFRNIHTANDFQYIGFAVFDCATHFAFKTIFKSFFYRSSFRSVFLKIRVLLDDYSSLVTAFMLSCSFIKAIKSSKLTYLQSNRKILKEGTVVIVTLPRTRFLQSASEPQS